MNHKRINTQIIFPLLFTFMLVFALGHCSTDSRWHAVNSDPLSIAPDPATHPEAVIEFYSANLYGWRGLFCVHTWFAIKVNGAKEYNVYELEGWRVKKGLSAIHHYTTTTPDKNWFGGTKPYRILSIKGQRAARLIPRVLDAIHRYPWRDEYSAFPGPNNNTFPAWIGTQIPQLNLDMPLKAIGSSYAD